MNGQAHGQEPATEAEVGEADGKRERSSIGFPYLTLVEAMEVADAIHGHVGNSSCADDQLAPWLSVSPKSSGYRLRVSAAKLFELIESPAKGTYRLTALGRRIVDREQRSKAKSESFLKVPLFNAVYERFLGSALPPNAALEREFAELGVATKQTAKARSSFERSAREAGYFMEGADRLVKPGFTESGPPMAKAPPEEDKPPRTSDDHLGGGGDGRHPFIEGLLQSLPTPNTLWSTEGRVAWLKAASTCFDLMYRGEGTINIEGQANPTKAAQDTNEASAA